MSSEILKFEDQIYSQVTDNLSALAKALADSQTMINDLKQIAEEKNKAISNAENAASEALLKLLNADNEIEKLKSELEEAEANAGLYERLKTKSGKLADLIIAEQEKCKKYDDAVKLYDELSKDLKEENKRLTSALKSSQDDYNNCQQSLDGEIAAHRKDNKEKDSKIKSLEGQVEKLTSDKGDLAKKLEFSQNIYTQLKTEKELLEGKLNKANDELTTVNGELKSTEELLKSSKKEEGLLNEHIKELESTNTNQEINRLKEDIKWLRNYAAATDDKVKRYFQVHTKHARDDEALPNHRNFLEYDEKDINWKKFFGDGCNDYLKSITNFSAGGSTEKEIKETPCKSK